MHEKLAAARLRLARGHPYLAAALWMLQPVENELVPLAAVDARWRLYYNPTAVAGLDVKVLEGVLYHEVLHLLRDHAGRAKAMNAEMRRYNVAADLEINDDIRYECELPEWTIFPSTFGLPNGLLAEEYYHRLSDLPEGGEVAGGVCGSCAHGQRESWEEPGDGDGSGLSAAEAELVRRKVAADVAEAVQKSHSAVPRHLARWARDRLQPKVDWRRVLAGMVRAALSHVAGAVDYTYTRPSRRSPAVPAVVLPALRRPTPEVAIVVDTSGSMSEKELSQALAEVQGVLLSVFAAYLRGIETAAVVPPGENRGEFAAYLRGIET